MDVLFLLRLLQGLWAWSRSVSQVARALTQGFTRIELWWGYFLSSERGVHWEWVAYSCASKLLWPTTCGGCGQALCFRSLCKPCAHPLALVELFYDDVVSCRSHVVRYDPVGSLVDGADGFD